MFWKTKDEKRSLPELPPMKPMFTKPMPEEEPETALPSFPESPSGRKFAQAAIKEAVEEEESVAPRVIREIFPRAREMSESEETAKVVFSREEKKMPEDVYVKIDRFHSARKALNAAREKLQDMDALMKKIRETRMREEQELASWEKEIGSVKTKVEDVTNNIFEKV